MDTSPTLSVERLYVSLNDGVTLKMVSDGLRHASIQITADVYVVTEDKRQRGVSERIERLFNIGKKVMFSPRSRHTRTPRLRFFSSLK